MKIRPAALDDIEQIDTIHARAIRELCNFDYSPQQIEAWAGNHTLDLYRPLVENSRFFVAELDGKIVGYARYCLESCEFCSLHVNPDYARQGVGTALAHYILEDARQNGLNNMWLDSSLTAVPFYSIIGFKWIEETTHAFRDVPLKCVRMEIDLN